MQHGHSRTFMMSCLTRSASSTTCLRFVPLVVGGAEDEPSSVVDERSCITGAVVTGGANNMKKSDKMNYYSE